MTEPSSLSLSSLVIYFDPGLQERGGQWWRRGWIVL